MKQQIEQLIDSLADKSLTFDDVLHVQVYGGLAKKLGTYSGAKVSLFADLGNYSSRPPEVWARRELFQKKRMDQASGYEERQGSPIYFHIQSKVKITRELLDHISEKIAKILPPPILIGDVIKRMDCKNGCEPGCKVWDNITTLVDLWCDVDTSKSLQSILAECEWEEICAKEDSDGMGYECTEAPKQKPIRHLFEFLLSLNLAE